MPLVVPAKIRVPSPDALPRERLEARLADAWRHRLAVVVAPAGSGKTTLLASFAASAGVPVAWYRAETWDTDEAAILRHLEAALTAALVGLPDRWQSVEDSAAALESWKGERAILIVDDAHGLEGTAAEHALGRFVQYAPPWLASSIGSRLAPGFNLSRLRVSGELLEIGPDDLRFRAWEIERLFRDHYGDPVPPDDLAILARRTEGWAAGLQLFHLATRGKSAEERRRILSGAGSSSRLVREYLDLQRHGRPAQRAARLPRRYLRARPSDRDRLRDRLPAAAAAAPVCWRSCSGARSSRWSSTRPTVPTATTRSSGRISIASLSSASARRSPGSTTAGRGPCSRRPVRCPRPWRLQPGRGLGAVRRLLGGQGERLADGARAWLESLPPAIIRHEPWLELAYARRARAEGRWNDAMDAYGRAETGFGAHRAPRSPRAGSASRSGRGSSR